MILIQSIHFSYGNFGVRSCFMKNELSRGARRIRIAFKQHALLQIGILVAAWAGGEWLVSRADIPLPGGVIGFAVLVTCLYGGVVSPRWFAKGASGLLDHLALFFVPAMVALVGRPELFGILGVKLLLIVCMGTILVMGGTALIVEIGFRWRARFES
jgi:holin-like protein